MKPTICSRCKKNIAVIFITKVENGVSTNEGLCLKCARELKIKQVDDIVERMGITDEDLDNLNGEMMAMMQPEPDETDEDDIGSRTATEQGRDKAMKALSEFLRPEFLNRVDEIICFNRLSEENFRGIAAIMLGELKTALEEHGVALRWDESVIDYLVQKSYTLTYGARNLRRTIQKDIEDVVAEKLIDSYENPITAIGLQAQDGKLELSCL